MKHHRNPIIEYYKSGKIKQLIWVNGDVCRYEDFYENGRCPRIQYMKRGLLHKVQKRVSTEYFPNGKIKQYDTNGSREGNNIERRIIHHLFHITNSMVSFQNKNDPGGVIA